MLKSNLMPNEGSYSAFLNDWKTRIHSSQIKAAIAVNRELILLYWQLGQDILARQTQEGWGTKVIARLFADLRQEFPEMKEFAPRSRKYMRAFAEAYSEEQIVRQVVAQIPWGHIQLLLNNLKEPDQRLRYARQTKFLIELVLH